MGFKIEINNILRMDFDYPLSIGREYPFEKNGSRIYADDIQIWLIKNDWSAVAEIQIMKQERTQSRVKGSYKVLYIYTKEESHALSQIFKRMYGWT